MSNIYDRILREHPVMTKDEEFKVREELFGKDDEKLRETMIMRNIAIAINVANKMFSALRIGDFEDYVSDAIVGLSLAAKNFDFSRNVRFITYAKWVCMGAVGRHRRGGQFFTDEKAINTGSYGKDYCDDEDCEDYANRFLFANADDNDIFKDERFDDFERRDLIDYLLEKTYDLYRDGEIGKNCFDLFKMILEGKRDIDIHRYYGFKSTSNVTHYKRLVAQKLMSRLGLSWLDMMEGDSDCAEDCKKKREVDVKCPRAHVKSSWRTISFVKEKRVPMTSSIIGGSMYIGPLECEGCKRNESIPYVSRWDLYERHENTRAAEIIAEYESRMKAELERMQSFFP